VLAPALLQAALASHARAEQGMPVPWLREQRPQAASGLAIAPAPRSRTRQGRYNNVRSANPDQRPGARRARPCGLAQASGAEPGAAERPPAASLRQGSARLRCALPHGRDADAGPASAAPSPHSAEHGVSNFQAAGRARGGRGPIAVWMSELKWRFASRLSNRLACTKAAALDPPWPARAQHASCARPAAR